MQGRKTPMSQLVAGVPQEDVARIFDLMTEATQALWGEPSIDGLIKRGVQLLHDYFGFHAFIQLRLEGDGIHARRRDALFDLPGISPIDKDVLEDLVGQIKLLPIRSPEFQEGANAVFCQRRRFMFCVLREPQESLRILLWEQESNPDIVSHQLRLESRLVDHLAVQIQQVARWFHRLEKTESLLYRDDLTGLYNYRYLDVALESEIRRSLRYGGNFSLLFIDLDNFKPINDRYGHLAGSEVLKQVATVITGCLRDVDSVFRYGGDEYVVLLLESGPEVALRAAERIRKKLEEHGFHVGADEQAHVTASIGVASFPEHGRDKVVLLKRADEGMYVSKKQGKNRVRILELVEGDGTLPLGPQGAQAIQTDIKRGDVKL